MGDEGFRFGLGGWLPRWPYSLHRHLQQEVGMGETRHLEADHKRWSFATGKPRLEDGIERARIRTSHEVDMDPDHTLPTATCTGECEVQSPADHLGLLDRITFPSDGPILQDRVLTADPNQRAARRDHRDFGKGRIPCETFDPGKDD